MREAVGIGIAVIIVLVVWLNPGILSGVTDSFSKPVKAWINDPDSVAGKMPWQIDPDEVKRAAGKRTDGERRADRDPGETVSTRRDAGQRRDAVDPTPRGARDPGETDPGYPNATGGARKDAKTRRARPEETYTEKTLGAHAVAVQRARGL